MIARFIYSLVLALVSPLLLLPLIIKNRKRSIFQNRWKELLGVTPKSRSEAQPIWIHAVSVGECIAAIPLIKALSSQYPDIPLLVTTTTSTGAEQIERLGSIVEHRFMPVDFTFAVKRFLKVINPRQMLIIETELWPNTLNAVHRSGIPISVVNARLSAKSMNNYRKVTPLFRVISNSVEQILCQTLADAQHFEQLGVAKHKLHVTGSLKFDIQISESSIEEGLKLRKVIGNRPVWIAASTHDGEDKQIFDSHQNVLCRYPDALLIIVPRHPERFQAVYKLSRELNFTTISRRSEAPIAADMHVYIGDTMGEMFTMLKAADVCFMGGSLIGDKVGGHNLLEPTAIGIPSITGPSYYNFKDITELLVSEGITTIVQDSDELVAQLHNVFSNDRKDMSTLTNAFMDKHKGALAKTLLQIDSIKLK
ncbi:lipid IV(A) 3-deoxy-D-manno-octulosonic acid transferase [Vibrio scophthalmi]|uniref:lipid IV(A) 3-deoxy-D-manno-octulosonic acid transferase n=1 Tax=Vibrio scophthalmi TaxID=45658 RepID=UPI003872EE87